MAAGAHNRSPSGTANSLRILTAKLNPVAQQRLFEFLDVIDTDSAARFRSWLATASDSEVSAAAESLSRASHGREFADWCHSNDQSPAEAAAIASPAPHTHRRRRTHRGHRHSRIRAPGPHQDLAVGGAWLLGGFLVTIVSYTMAASSPGGGRYLIAYGAIGYGAFRILRGLKSG